MSSGVMQTEQLEILPELERLLGLNTSVALTVMTSVKSTTGNIGKEYVQQNCIEDTEDEQAAIERELQRQQELQQELAYMQRACTNVLFGLLGMQQTTRRLMAEREQLLEHLRPMMQEFGLTLDSLLEMQGVEVSPVSETTPDSTLSMQHQESVAAEASLQSQGVRRRRGGRRHRRSRNRNQSLAQGQAAPLGEGVPSEPESAPTTQEAILAITAMVARLPVAAMAA